MPRLISSLSARLRLSQYAVSSPSPVSLACLIHSRSSRAALTSPSLGLAPEGCEHGVGVGRVVGLGLVRLVGVARCLSLPGRIPTRRSPSFRGHPHEA